MCSECFRDVFLISVSVLCSQRLQKVVKKGNAGEEVEEAEHKLAWIVSVLSLSSLHAQ